MSDKVEMIFLSRCFLKKTNKRIRLYYYETSGQLVFVCFLEEIEDTIKTFRNQLAFSQNQFKSQSMFLKR